MTAITAFLLQSKVSLLGSNFEMMPRKTGASALIAHSDSSLRSARRSYFLPGFLASGHEECMASPAPQARLIALIAASGNRSVGGSSSTLSRNKSGGGGAAGVGLAPRAFGADRAAAPILLTIDADDLYTVFDPDGLNKQWTVNEVLR